MSSFMKSLSAILFPKAIKCCICGRPAREALCSGCLGALEYIEGRVCLKCGKDLDDHYEHNLCPDCIGQDKHFDLAFSCFRYRNMGKDIIHRLKYEGQKDAAAVLARLMQEKISDEGIRVEAVVPVPIHSSKKAARGFNQAQLIAEEIAAAEDVPLWDCLIRTKKTEEQFHLDKLHRTLNVHNAFCINLVYNSKKYKTVLLVDDIYTTGSTVDECSKVLKQHGVEKVYVVTAATGSNT